MGERYSEAKIRQQINAVPLAKRMEMMSAILETINISGIGVPRRDEMTSTLVAEGLTFTWRAWRTSLRKPIIFLENGGLDQDQTNWMSHVPDPLPTGSKRLKKRYSEYLERYYKDPITRGAVSTAIKLACMQREQTTS